MATKSASIRAILKFIADTGESPEQQFDEEITISGFDNISINRYTLANGADSTSYSLLGSDLAALVIYAVDYPFGLELAAAETEMANGRLFVWWGDDDDEAAYPNSSVLLTGNGTNDSELLIFQVQAPS